MLTETFESVADKTVLITGATGSFGRHITKALLKQGRLRRLVVFSRDEERQRVLGLQAKEFAASGVETTFVLGDVRDRESVYRALKGVDVAINAAALKQVPACELNAMEAVRTNVLGMQNVLDASRDQGVEQVLTISTDKAVEPINTMGMSKALQERLVQSYALRYDDNRVTVVRYGNVLGSTGSVLPVFIDQVRQNRRITITHPDMTRFLLTLDDALGLVSTALAGHECTGTTYVRHAPAVTVQQMADIVAELFADGAPIKVDVVGARPGDKAHEVLVSADEMRRSSRNGDYFVVPPINPTDRPGDAGNADELLAPAFSSDVAPQMSNDDLRQLVKAWCAASGVRV